MKETKIELTDSFNDIIFKLSEGNPGAMSFIFEIVKYKGGDFKQAIGEFLSIDVMHLYGSHLYMLWNDCCNRDVSKSLMIIDAYRKGIILDKDLKERIFNVGYGIKFDDLLEKDALC